MMIKSIAKLGQFSRLGLLEFATSVQNPFSHLSGMTQQGHSFDC